ncbi:MAG: archease [Rhodocyclaceae bacterium]|nr:archease [Rhodocyclaceae bacterium]
MMARWEHFRHEADIGVRGWGATREAAFGQAALALTAVLTDPASVAPLARVDIACGAPDDALLFCDWLNALIYEMATRHMLFSRFELSIVDGRLAGTAWGEPVDLARHQPAVEIKGATYTELDVHPLPEGGWLAQCVVDV